MPTTYSTSSSSTSAVARAPARNAFSAAVTTLAPVSMSARPTIRRFSSMMTALVCVDPTSTPLRMPWLHPSQRWRSRRLKPAARRQALEEGVDPVLQLRLGDDPLVHHVGLDEEATAMSRACISARRLSASPVERCGSS